VSGQLVEAVLRDCPELSSPRQLRILLAIAHDAAPGQRHAAPGLARLVELSGCNQRKVLTALAALRDQGLIERQTGHKGRRAVYTITAKGAGRLTPYEPDWVRDALHAIETERVQADQHPNDSQRVQDGQHPNAAKGAERLAPPTEETSIHPSPVPADRARDDNGDEPWRRGPGRAITPTKVYQPGHGPGRDNRPTPMPPSWQSPRTIPDPEVVERGMAKVRAAFAKRTPKPGEPPPKPRTEPEWRQEAARQARSAQRRRALTDPPPVSDDDEGPPDEIPF